MEDSGAKRTGVTVSESPPVQQYSAGAISRAPPVATSKRGFRSSLRGSGPAGDRASSSRRMRPWEASESSSQRTSPAAGSFQLTPALGQRGGGRLRYGLAFACRPLAGAQHFPRRRPYRCYAPYRDPPLQHGKPTATVLELGAQYPRPDLAKLPDHECRHLRTACGAAQQFIPPLAAARLRHAICAAGPRLSHIGQPALGSDPSRRACVGTPVLQPAWLPPAAQPSPK